MKNQRAFAKFTQNMEPLVLIVDEDEMMREMLMVALRSEGFRSVYPVSTASEALRFTRGLLPDLLIIDYELSHTTGLQLYDQIHRTHVFRPIPGILVSAPFLSEEVKPRPLWIVQEPFDLDTFFASVRQAILVSSPQSAKVSSKRLKEVIIFMRAKQTSLLSAVHVLSLGFFCGLLLIPLGGLLLRSLILYYREKKKESMPPVTLYPLVKTERGMVIQVIPRSLVENEREAARLPAMAR